MNKSSRFATFYLPFILIAVGIFLRFSHYLANRSFWLDEAWVALDLNHRSLLEIFTSENYIKPVPIGFALMCKMFRQLLGNYEYAFRLFPFLSAIVSLFLYYAFLKRVVSSLTVLLALGLFALCESLIYYAAELKYYSSDVMVTLLLFLLTVIFEQRGMKDFHMLILAIAGSLALWISHVAVFIFAAIAVTFGFLYWSRKKPKQLYKFLLIQSLWLVNFIIMYLVTFSKIESYHGLKKMWDVGFWPSPLWSLESAAWLKNALLGLLKDPAGLQFPLLGAFLFVLGFFHFLKTRCDRCLMLAIPILLVLVASVFRKYPFSGRVLVFLVPIVLLFIAEGITFIIEKKRKDYILAMLLVVLVFFYPIKNGLYYLRHPHVREDIRPVMLYLKERQQEGDSLYLNASARYAYWYYLQYYHFENSSKLEGVFTDELAYDDTGPFSYWFPVVSYHFNIMDYPLVEFLPGEVMRSVTEDFIRFQGPPRVWVLFTHCEPSLQQFILNGLHHTGQKIDEFHSEGVVLYLFDLRAS